MQHLGVCGNNWVREILSANMPPLLLSYALTDWRSMWHWAADLPGVASAPLCMPGLIGFQLAVWYFQYLSSRVHNTSLIYVIAWRSILLERNNQGIWMLSIQREEEGSKVAGNYPKGCVGWRGPLHLLFMFQKGIYTNKPYLGAISTSTMTLS